MIATTLLFSALVAATAAPAAELTTAHRLVSLVDYVGADYPAAVDAGEIIDTFEYEEQLDLVRTARESARTLTVETAGEPSIVELIADVETAIGARADAARVASACAIVRDALIDRYRLPTFPDQVPDRARGQQLFVASCVPCHGADGSGDPVLRATLKPPPANLLDTAITDGLSPYRAFNTATFGIPGTSMPSFQEVLTPTDRWDLAFFAMTLRHAGDDDAKADHDDAGLPMQLSELAIATDGDLRATAAAAGLEPASVERAVAWARTGEPFQPPLRPLELARRYLDRSLHLARRGDHVQAGQLAMAAYLDGVEPVEGIVKAGDPKLVAALEASVLRYRQALRREAPLGELERAVAELDEQLVAATEVVARPAASPWYAFLAAFLIVLREGVEATLIVGAIIAILRRAAPDDRAAVRRVHAAWISAIALGFVTWLVATRFLTIDTAVREAAEGIIALIAAALLFTASYWLLSNLEVKRWLGYVRSKVEGSVSAGRGMALFGVAFLAAYREVFETVLFLQALLLGGRAPGWIAAGALAAVGALLVVVWALFRVGARLPLKPFFAASSALLGLLSFVLAGQGIHALQQIGWLPAAVIAGPTLPSLGIHPTLPGMAAQGVIVVLFALAIVHTLLIAPRRQSS